MVRRNADRVLIRRAAAVALALVLAPRTAGAIELVALGGERQVVPSGTASSPLILHYFATWCPACRDELQSLDRLAATCRGARVVLVDVDETPDVVRAWIAPLMLRAPVLLDEGGRSWRGHGFRGLPATWIEAGSSSRVEGPLTREAWSERLARLGCGAPQSGKRDRPPQEEGQRGGLDAEASGIAPPG